MPYSVLIVDDHDIIREGIKNILRNQPSYKVVGDAGDGEEALKKAQELKPDILLLDITMPKKGGLDIIPQINRVSKNTKILIISVHKADAYIMMALKAGVRGYLNKENAAEELLPALRKITAGHVYLSDTASAYLLKKTSQSPSELAAEKILTGKEEEVLRLVAEGKTAKEIADTLFISPRTVENYKNNILKKLGFHKTSDLIKYAIKNKIVDMEDV